MKFNQFSTTWVGKIHDALMWQEGHIENAQNIQSHDAGSAWILIATELQQ